MQAGPPLEEPSFFSRARDTVGDFHRSVVDSKAPSPYSFNPNRAYLQVHRDLNELNSVRETPPSSTEMRNIRWGLNAVGVFPFLLAGGGLLAPLLPAGAEAGAVAAAPEAGTLGTTLTLIQGGSTAAASTTAATETAGTTATLAKAASVAGAAVLTALASGEAKAASPIEQGDRKDVEAVGQDSYVKLNARAAGDIYDADNQRIYVTPSDKGDTVYLNEKTGEIVVICDFKGSGPSFTRYGASSIRLADGDKKLKTYDGRIIEGGLEGLKAKTLHLRNKDGSYIDPNPTPPPIPSPAPEPGKD